MTEDTPDEIRAGNDFIGRMAFPDRYTSEKPDKLTVWILRILLIAFGFFLGHTFAGDTEYIEQPPRSVPQHKVVQYMDSAYSITTTIDSAYYELRPEVF